MVKRYGREQELMLSLIHLNGQKVARDHLGPSSQASSRPNSWLGQQRRNVRGQTYDWRPIRLTISYSSAKFFDGEQQIIIRVKSRILAIFAHLHLYIRIPTNTYYAFNKQLYGMTEVISLSIH